MRIGYANKSILCLFLERKIIIFIILNFFNNTQCLEDKKSNFNEYGFIDFLKLNFIKIIYLFYLLNNGKTIIKK